MSGKSPYRRRGAPSKPGTVKPKSTIAAQAAATKIIDTPVRLPSRDDHADEAVFHSPARPAAPSPPQSGREASADEDFDAGAKKRSEDES